MKLISSETVQPDRKSKYKYEITARALPARAQSAWKHKQHTHIKLQTTLALFASRPAALKQKCNEPEVVSHCNIEFKYLKN